MKILKLTMLLWATFFMISCSSNDDDASSEPVKVSFYLTDAPAAAEFKAVYLDVKSIEYNTDECTWIDIPVKSAQIELLQFNNGTDTLLSNITLTRGEKIKQVRLHLGENNKLELADGSVAELKVPSGSSSGLKIQVQSVAEMTSGYKVVIDFDAKRSIVVKGNGKYSLKPVVRAYIEANTSSIYGTLLPVDTPRKVFTVVGKDTIATMSDPLRGNYFKLHGLFTGKYKVEVADIVHPDQSIVIGEVDLIGGKDTDLGVVDLRPGEDGGVDPVTE